MAGGKKKDDVLKVSASSKSPQDLEAEIAAAADAIAGAETVDGIPVFELEVPEDDPKPAKKIPVKKKAAPKKAATKKTTKKPKSTTKAKVAPAAKKKTTPRKGKVMATSDVRPAKKTPKKVTKARVTSSEEAKPSAVKVTVKPKTLAGKQTEASEDGNVILNRRGKDLQPIGDAKKLKAVQEKPLAKPAKSQAKAVTSSVKVGKQKKSEHAKPYEVVKVAAKKSPVPAQLSSSLATKPAPAKPAEKHTPHVARIYDTRTYHIPITVDHHHRKAMMPMWAQVLTVLAGVAALALLALVFDVVDF